jgi:hypothetical protein
MATPKPKLQGVTETVATAHTLASNVLRLDEGMVHDHGHALVLIPEAEWAALVALARKVVKP